MASSHDTSASASDRFLALLQPLERDLERYARHLIWEPQQIPDALQNTVMRAFAAFDRYHESGRFRAWLFKILTHEVFALNRRHARIARHEFQLEPEEIADLAGADASGTGYAHGREKGLEGLDEILDEDLVKSLKTLTDLERAVLLLRAIGEFRYREISEALGIPLGSVMGDLARARQKMRAALHHTRRSAKSKRTSYDDHEL